MSKDPLVLPIEGYRIALLKEGEPVDDFNLRLSKVGGAHVRGVADLITQIEDAVFKQEEEDAKHDT